MRHSLNRHLVSNLPKRIMRLFISTLAPNHNNVNLDRTISSLLGRTENTRRGHENIMYLLTPTPFKTLTILLWAFFFLYSYFSGIDPHSDRILLSLAITSLGGINRFPSSIISLESMFFLSTHDGIIYFPELVLLLPTAAFLEHRGWMDFSLPYKSPSTPLSLV